NVLGVFTNLIPASLLNLTATDGALSFPTRASGLAFGTNRFTINLFDSHGLASSAFQFTEILAGAGSGGVAPAINSFGPNTASWNRPGGPLDRLDVYYT